MLLLLLLYVHDNTLLLLLVSDVFRYQGHVSAALILGGVDIHGPHILSVGLLG